MNKKTNWEKPVRRIELLMRLKSFPVAFKMLEKKQDLEEIPFIRTTEHKVTLCQLITRVRNFDWTVGADADSFLFSTCPSVIGLADVPDTHKDGTFRNIIWVAKKQDGKKFEESIPRLPLNKFEAVAMGPLVYHPFDPDIVLIYANPAQIMLLINSLQFEDYEVMQFYCVGESSCSDAIARCYLTGKPSLSIPCYGERRYGHAQDDELVMAIPAQMMEKALRGMEALYRRGVRYPVSFAGAESDVGQMFPVTYKGLDHVMKKVRGNDNRLIVGITGGIACGKTTVTDMFQEPGAFLIDFDLIARKVVEPGAPGLEKIVDYFGKQVLQEDGYLDRKAVSDIVFKDIEKRKKLESFTHPAIYEEFFKQVNEIASKNQDPIIQVAIPLLIEINLQYLFDKVIVVYLPEKKQIERLALRDKISESEAAGILKSQLPIDDKIGFADFIINNENSVEQTRKQVEDVYSKLNRFQKSRVR